MGNQNGLTLLIGKEKGKGKHSGSNHTDIWVPKKNTGVGETSMAKSSKEIRNEEDLGNSGSKLQTATEIHISTKSNNHPTAIPALNMSVPNPQTARGERGRVDPGVDIISTQGEKCPVISSFIAQTKQPQPSSSNGA